MSDGDPASTSVVLVNEQALPVDEERLRDLALRVARSEGAPGEISILLVGVDRMAGLNRVFMGEDGPTDVLAFPIDGRAAGEAEGPPVLVGEIVVCPEVAAGQAGRDLASELDLLVAHGVLHLLGYDHDDERAAAQMRAREQNLTGNSEAQAP